MDKQFDQIDPSSPSIFDTLLTRLHQFVCRHRSHTKHFDQGRYFLRCDSCGMESPGWEVHLTPTRHSGRIKA